MPKPTDHDVIAEIQRSRRWMANYPDFLAKADAELAKYPPQDVQRIAIEHALARARDAAQVAFSDSYDRSGAPVMKVALKVEIGSYE